MNNIEKNVVAVKQEDYIKIESEFFDKDYIIESDYINYRIDKGGQRFYVRCFEDKHLIAPSFSEVVRTVTGIPDGLARWFQDLDKEQSLFEGINSANYGKFLHIYFAKILRGENTTPSESFLLNEVKIFCEENNYSYNEFHKWYKYKKRKIADDIIGFICWIRDYNVKPIAMEYPLMHPDGLYAGTCDLICKLTIEGQEYIALIDFKSTQKAFHEDNEIQLHAYRRLWNLEHPEYLVEKIFNLGCNSFRKKTLYNYLSGEKTGNFKPYSFKDQTESTNLFKWDLYLELYHKDPGNMVFGNTYEYDEITTINKDSDLSEIMYEYNIVEDIVGEAKKEDEKQDS